MYYIIFPSFWLYEPLPKLNVIKLQIGIGIIDTRILNVRNGCPCLLCFAGFNLRLEIFLCNIYKQTVESFPKALAQGFKLIHMITEYVHTTTKQAFERNPTNHQPCRLDFIDQKLRRSIRCTSIHLFIRLLCERLL